MAKRTLSLGDITSLVTAFQGLRGIAGSPEFGYAVAHNRRALSPHLASMSDAAAPSKEAIAFEQERHGLALRLAVKENGKPVIERGIVRLAEPELYEQELGELKKRYPKGAEDAERALNVEQELMRKSIEVTLCTVTLNEVPTGVPVNLFDPLMPMIEAPFDTTKKSEE